MIKKYSIAAKDILRDAQTYLTKMYGRTRETFSPASPFGQILTVISHITEHIFYYIEHSVTEQSLQTAQHDESIYGLSRLTGHDPYRGSAAFGGVQMKIKNSARDKINAQYLLFNTKTAIVTNKTTSLKYTILFGDIFNRINMKSKDSYQVYEFEIVQGEFEKQTLTSNGESLSSYNITTTGMIDHNRINVYVNGQLWTKYDSLYDMNARTRGYLVKTGISGGLDLFFGNGEFGMIPEAGNQIVVEYLVHVGSDGNVYNDDTIDYQLEGECSDSGGESHSLMEIFDIVSKKSPKMGADVENIEFTKLIAPLMSKSFVLASPENYEHFLSKYNLFSYIDVYNTKNDDFVYDDNVVYMFLLPDLKAKFGNNVNYFSIPKDRLVFTNDDYNAILKVIGDSGQQLVTSEIQIVKPEIKLFKLEVFAKIFEGYEADSITPEIESAVSNYMLNNKRRDRIPKSDFIRIIENINGIDSVNVRFISADEEKIRKDGFYIKKTKTLKPIQPTEDNLGRIILYDNIVTDTVIKIKEGEVIPYDVSNIDNFGDIVLNDGEICAFRGGWTDSNGVEVVDEVGPNINGALTIYYDSIKSPNNTTFINTLNN